MASGRLSKALLAAVAACGCALALGACGEEPGTEEAAREGLAIDVGGIDYNIFITRELNLEIPPDEAYYDGPAAPPGKALYGVFLQACNVSDRPLTTTADFAIEDNQGEEFEPMELPEDNAFAYSATDLDEGDCTPEAGSVAQQGPSAGSMLLFEFPIKSTENRPFELTITPPPGGGEPKRVELDL